MKIKSLANSDSNTPALEHVFTIGKFMYQQIRKGNKAYIYAKDRYHKQKIKGKSVVETERLSYIVFEIKDRKGRHQFPHDAAFQCWAWCCKDIKSALNKFNILEAEGDPNYVVDPVNNWSTYEKTFHGSGETNIEGR